jgi:hydroxymethylglutaryl-CoA reductase (NADPH)
MNFLPPRLRGANNPNPASPPSYLNRKITPILQSLSQPAFHHPIRTIVFILVLASSSYIGLLEGSLFETRTSGTIGQIDLPTLVDGGRQLRMDQETGWKWQTDTHSSHELGKVCRKGAMAWYRADEQQNVDHLALVTLVFPNSLSTSAPQSAPAPDLLPVPGNLSLRILPSTLNPFSPYSQDTALAYSIPWAETKQLLQGLGEIPEKNGDDADSGRVWTARASRNAQGSLKKWVGNAWTEFVDLLKHAETLDITIMSLGYLSMHLTFVSLFISMRRLGSNFWLATTTLFSSVFAFLFGLVVTTHLGVPINMVLLSEGLPFLVVTVGFEKPIVLTKAVLSASINARRQAGAPASPAAPAKPAPPTPKSVQHAVNSAVKEKGFDIVRDYAIEIAILIAGAASGVQGGLRQFCFLAAWILFFDCILLFTFYIAILCVKLEINRIKRHVALRRALEEDGVSGRVAENVASSSEWPKMENGDHGSGQGTYIFGRRVSDRSVPKFKFLLFGGFLLLNLINIMTIPFRSGNKNAQSPAISAIQGVVSSPPIDPFKVAENGLDFIHGAALAKKMPTVVTVLAPIKYELWLADSLGHGEPYEEADFAEQILDSMGGKVIEGVLKSLEDPILSKWIVVALTMSLALNGYLFNAARWSIKDPRTGDESTSAQRAVSPPPQSPPSSPKIMLNGKPPENGNAKEPADNKANLRLDVERSQEECEQMVKAGDAARLTDRELLGLTVSGKIQSHALEKSLDNPQVMSKLESLTRAVKIRRGFVSRTPATAETSSILERSKLPYKGYNYENVHGACCENVIGYLPLPVGVAGPLVIDGQSFYIPMATTEGVLVASTNRGCKAINAGGGATTVITGDGMTRGPCVGFETLTRAGAAKVWLDSEDGQKTMRTAFNSTSRFARLQTMQTALAGTYLYIRFKTTTGDAMGMNMISKGVECALNVMRTEAGFDDMSIISVSGNYCTDKKPAAINWIDGRGKSVVAEAIIPGEVVRKTLKSDVDALVELNMTKNLIGSAMAGSIGGFNAHAANLVAATFLATGQDPAQVVESANCITVMKK